MSAKPRLTYICASLCALLNALPAESADKLTSNTLKLSKGEASPGATIADMAWYAGHWTGQALGGFNEEIWSAPKGGVMMGMYRMLRDDKVVFYELLTIAEAAGSIAIRLKHFHPELRGWEERDHVVTFPLVAKRDGRIYFDGMTFEPRGDNAVTVYLAIENRKDGSVREEVFSYTRSAVAPNPSHPAGTHTDSR